MKSDISDLKASFQKEMDKIHQNIGLIMEKLQIS